MSQTNTAREKLQLANKLNRIGFTTNNNNTITITQNHNKFAGTISTEDGYYVLEVENLFFKNSNLEEFLEMILEAIERHIKVKKSIYGENWRETNNEFFENTKQS